MASRVRQLFPRERLQFAFGRVHRGFKGARQGRARRIHAAHFEHNGDRLHPVVALPAQGKGNVCPGSHIAIARSVDHRMRQNGLAAALVFDDHALDCVSLHNDVHRHSI